MALENWDELFEEVSREWDVDWPVESEDVRVLARVYLPNEDRHATFRVIGVEPDADIMFINLGAEVTDAS